MEDKRRKSLLIVLDEIKSGLQNVINLTKDHRLYMLFLLLLGEQGKAKSCSTNTIVPKSLGDLHIPKPKHPEMVPLW